MSASDRHRGQLHRIPVLRAKWSLTSDCLMSNGQTAGHKKEKSEEERAKRKERRGQSAA